MSSEIYLRCSSGFGNKIFDLISAIYLKNKYNVTVYFAIDLSKHDSIEDPFFGKIFNKSFQKVKYIRMKKYYYLEKTLPIEITYIENLEDLPVKISKPTRFAGMYRFAYTMYETFSDADKSIFNVNKQLISSDIVNIPRDYACVHIRYGDKLCYSYKPFGEKKYSAYTLPIYTPQYFIDQINIFLEKNDVNEIFVITDSVDLVNKYVMNIFKENNKIKLFNSKYLDAFYLLTRAKYIVLSHSTFSFAAAYFNPTATSYLVKKYLIDPKKDYLYEDDAISPYWIIIDNKDYLLNFNQELLGKMVDDYGNCDRYVGKK